MATSPPDGYTLLAGTAGSLSISPQLYKNAGVDPVKDFSAVALVSSAPLVLAIQKSVPAHSVKELVAYANANPGKLNYGAVIGTPPHLSGEMFKHITGANIVFVPYKSAAQATTDVLAGQMNMTFEGTTAMVPFIKSGQLRALAVTSPQRIPEIPDVPTMDELGYTGMPPDSWQAIVAPAGTPTDMVDEDQYRGESGPRHSGGAEAKSLSSAASRSRNPCRNSPLSLSPVQALGRSDPHHWRRIELSQRTRPGQRR